MALGGEVPLDAHEYAKSCQPYAMKTHIMSASPAPTQKDVKSFPKKRNKGPSRFFSRCLQSPHESRASDGFRVPVSISTSIPISTSSLSMYLYNIYIYTPKV